MTRHLLISALFALATIGYAADEVTVSGNTSSGPLSKFYVAETRGKVDITQDGSIHSASNRDVFKAPLATLRTGKESDLAIVLSSNTGFALAQNTTLEIKKLEQAPFMPSNDLDVEPSVSKGAYYIPAGIVSICTSRPVDGSHSLFQTPDALISTTGRHLEIEVQDNRTFVRLLDGNVTLLDDQKNPIKLGENQEAIITRNPNGTVSFAPDIHDLTKDQRSRILDRITLACTSRKTVYFEMVEVQNPNGTKERDINVTQLIPANTSTEYTISPANIP